MEPTKKRTGRPSKYTPELAREITERLSEGEPLRQICRDAHMPEWRTIYDWMYRDETLSAAIARAREIGYDKMAEEVLQIADTPVMGHTQTVDDKGSTIRTEDMLGHRKLQIETRLKLLAKWNPKKYGDRTTIAGDADNPLKVDVDAKELFDRILTNMELAKQVKSNEDNQ
jgi:IS30 family transposase